MLLFDISLLDIRRSLALQSCNSYLVIYFIIYCILLELQALKLSDDLHLNEIDCVQLLVSANQEVSIVLNLII